MPINSYSITDVNSRPHNIQHSLIKVERGIFVYIRKVTCIRLDDLVKTAHKNFFMLSLVLYYNTLKFMISFLFYSIFLANEIINQTIILFI